MSDRARREQFGNLGALPDERVSVVRDRLFSADDFDRLTAGLVPQAMEDRWFVFFEDPWLYCHRSWTGAFVYRGRFVSEGDGSRLVEVEMGPSRYTPGIEAPDKGAAFFEWIVDALVLGRDVPRVC